MAGRTISGYVDEGIAQRVERIAEVEERKLSQVTASALGLYALLPQEAHAALRRVEAFGEPEDLARAARQITRVLLDIQYDVAERAMIESMDTSEFGDLDSEEAILEAAARLVQPKGDSAPGGSAPTGLRHRAERALRGGEERPGSGRGARSTR